MASSLGPILLRQQLRKSRLLSQPRVFSGLWKSQSPTSTTTCAGLHRGLASDSNGAPTRVRRRKRPYYGVSKVEGMGPPKAAPESAGLSQPYAFGGEDGEGTDEYLKKTSLSPWVPIPDPIARNLFDMARTGPEDIHVELGCGDGRVNFYAIDHGKVKKSTGIDIDDGIMAQARERLLKRYPQPPIEFITADLLDYNNDEVWENIQEATVITMYFVQEALREFRPLLEEKLAGRQCKIICCAYPMPGWNHTSFETTLGTTCYLYDWGSDDNTIFADDSMLIEKPKEVLEDPFVKMRAQGMDMGKIQHVPRRILPQPSGWDETGDWTTDEEESDDEEEEEDSDDDETDPSKSK